MAIAVVSRPQEFPKGTFPSPLKTHRKPNPNTSRPRSDRRNRNTSENEPVVKSPVPNLVMGQVKILKRGEELKSPITFPTQAPTPKSEQKTALSPKFEQKTKTKKAVVFKPKKQDEETKKKASITPMKQDEETKLFTTDRFGPEPDKVPKKTHLTENFAGSVFVTSPSPSDLPFPAFFNKKKSVNIDATNSLLRLLHLDLVQA